MDLKNAIRDVRERVQRTEILGSDLADRLSRAEYDHAQAVVRELRRRIDDLHGILMRHAGDVD